MKRNIMKQSLTIQSTEWQAVVIEPGYKDGTLTVNYGSGNYYVKENPRNVKPGPYTSVTLAVEHFGRDQQIRTGVILSCEPWKKGA